MRAVCRPIVWNMSKSYILRFPTVSIIICIVNDIYLYVIIVGICVVNTKFLEIFRNKIFITSTYLAEIIDDK